MILMVICIVMKVQKLKNIFTVMHGIGQTLYEFIVRIFL